MLFNSISPVMTPGGDIRYERYAEQSKHEPTKKLNFIINLPTPEDRLKAKLRPKPGTRRRSQGLRRNNDLGATFESPKDDDQIVEMVCKGQMKCYSLETILGDCSRAVKIRREVLARGQPQDSTSAGEMKALLKLSYESFDWSRVCNNCCENSVGYVPIPVGMAGPLLVDDRLHQIPMATTEGALVASTCRGCKAINAAGGATTILTTNGITRAPCVRFPTASQAGCAKKWLDSEPGLRMMAKAFDSTSRFARLQRITASVAGPYLYIRFVATTGDAMGMNMISKGVERALEVMSGEAECAEMKVVCLSSNLCTDKKPSAINWIEGRGKGVIAEAFIPAEIVANVLKTSVKSLIELNMAKNHIGSAMAGSIGGQNAHAANIVAAMFLATGQDMAQVVESSNCMTIMRDVDGQLHISVSMPSIEVGTVGGGTNLVSQSAMLDVLGVGSKADLAPGENACRLARIIGAATLAGELSLCSALASGSLVNAHMQLNRKANTEMPMTRLQ